MVGQARPDRLHLPTDIANMRFFDVSGVDAQDLEDAEQEVLAREHAEFPQYFLIEWESWQKVLARSEPEGKERARQKLQDMLSGYDQAVTAQLAVYEKLTRELFIRRAVTPLAEVDFHATLRVPLAEVARCSRPNFLGVIMKREFLLPGAPLLRQIAIPVDVFQTPELRDLIDDMFETMRDGRGVGLAAPQIGVSKRVIVFEFAGGDRAPGQPPVPATVLINPTITSSEGSVEDWEGCFSVPGYRGWVTRAERIHYLAQGFCGERIEGIAEGFHARIIQHEIDHLNGVLYTDIANRVEPFARPAQSR
ncbi:peptide deformylase [Pandoraea horticolens]|uniref:Peptide deformylase n=1 Tax=Pandoraea horticolens TaxID=2508298 RepID=A0A5E4WJX4_9BURK|nr:peptide deformylase [Pandoraea horticolens]VVE23890.1 peptide deformylase [Pandoraea horticolens]